MVANRGEDERQVAAATSQQVTTTTNVIRIASPGAPSATCREPLCHRCATSAGRSRKCLSAPSDTASTSPAAATATRATVAIEENRTTSSPIRASSTRRYRHDASTASVITPPKPDAAGNDMHAVHDRVQRARPLGDGVAIEPEGHDEERNTKQPPPSTIHGPNVHGVPDPAWVNRRRGPRRGHRSLPPTASWAWG
jgi:hypothetical protein